MLPEFLNYNAENKYIMPRIERLFAPSIEQQVRAALKVIDVAHRERKPADE